jgi:spore coat protein U-like protein
MKRSVINVVLAVSILLISSSAFAVTVSSTNNNNVTATVNGSCRWDTPLTMAFGAYDPFAAGALTQNASIAFRCVKLTNATNTYKVWFNKTGGNMTDGTDNLAYTLTSGGNPLPTTAAGATTVVGVAGVGVGAGYTFTVDGSVAPGQDVRVGSYQDTVVANIEY